MSISKRFKLFSEALALDWLPIVINDSKFQKEKLTGSDFNKDVNERVTKVKDDNCELIFNQFNSSLKEDDERRKELDHKASNTIGYVGIISTVIIGIAPFILKNIYHSLATRLLSLSSILLLILCLGITLIISIRAIEVGKSDYMSINLKDLLDDRLTNKNKIYKLLASDTLKCFEHNRSLINDKAHYVRGAQDWFRNSILALLIMLMLSIFIILFCEPHETSKNTDKYKSIINIENKEINNKSINDSTYILCPKTDL